MGPRSLGCSIGWLQNTRVYELQMLDKNNLKSQWLIILTTDLPPLYVFSILVWPVACRCTFLSWRGSQQYKASQHTNTSEASVASWPTDIPVVTVATWSSPTNGVMVYISRILGGRHDNGTRQRNKKLGTIIQCHVMHRGGPVLPEDTKDMTQKLNSIAFQCPKTVDSEYQVLSGVIKKQIITLMVSIKCTRVQSLILGFIIQSSTLHKEGRHYLVLPFP